MKNPRETEICRKVCGAWCCKNLVFFLSDPMGTDRRFWAVRGAIVDGDRVYIPKKCQWLGDDNLCKRYSERPESCRVYRCEKLQKATEPGRLPNNLI